MTPLPAILEIRGAEALQRELLQALDRGDHELEAGAVEQADTASLQLLLAFTLDARRRGGAPRLLRPSPALVAAAHRLGLGAALGTEAP